MAVKDSEYEQKLDELSGLIAEHRKKLIQLERVIAKRREEEEALINKAV